MNVTGEDRLQLTDWRRRVGELYADVRGCAVPADAHARWRAVREELYRNHAASPVPPDRRAGFRAIHFPYDPAFRYELPLIRIEATGPGDATSGDATSDPRGRAEAAAPLALRLPISAGQPLAFERVGWVEVPFEAGLRRLTLFWLPEYAGGLFMPFRDATNGSATYGGGRYLLDTGKGADLGGDPNRGTVVVDFNFAYQPSCAFGPRWSCPLAPLENHLDLEVRAGERIA